LRVESDGIRDWKTLMDGLARQPHVVAAAPAIYEQVLISRGARARGAVLKGIIPTDERKVSDLLKSIRIGTADALMRSQNPQSRAQQETQLRRLPMRLPTYKIA